MTSNFPKEFSFLEKHLVTVAVISAAFSAHPLGNLFINNYSSNNNNDCFMFG